MWSLLECTVRYIIIHLCFLLRENTEWEFLHKVLQFYCYFSCCYLFLPSQNLLVKNQYSKRSLKFFEDKRGNFNMRKGEIIFQGIENIIIHTFINFGKIRSCWIISKILINLYNKESTKHQRE
jgi:hypothetical protein